MNLLLVNDEAVSATILRDVLEAGGDQVFLAGCATEAARLAKDDNPETIIVIAPIILETARLLRGSGYDGQIVGISLVPVTQGDRQAALEAGCNDFRHGFWGLY